MYEFGDCPRETGTYGNHSLGAMNVQSVNTKLHISLMRLMLMKKYYSEKISTGINKPILEPHSSQMLELKKYNILLVLLDG